MDGYDVWKIESETRNLVADRRVDLTGTRKTIKYVESINLVQVFTALDPNIVP